MKTRSEITKAIHADIAMNSDVVEAERESPNAMRKSKMGSHPRQSLSQRISGL
jgi:hypothetical protein